MKPNDINLEIKLIDKRLNKINEEKLKLENQKKELQKQLANHNTKTHSLSTSKTFSTEQKLQMFSDLFKGRHDIHALRWENKFNKSGYSVACLNERVIANTHLLSLTQLTNIAFPFTQQGQRS